VGIGRPRQGRFKPMRFLTSNMERAGRACPGLDPGDAGPHHLLWWRRASVPAIFTRTKAHWCQTACYAALRVLCTLVFTRIALTL